MNQEDIRKKKLEKDQDPKQGDRHHKPKNPPRWQGHPSLGFDTQSEVLKNFSWEPPHKEPPHNTPPHSEGTAKKPKIKGRCVIVHGAASLEAWAKNHLSPWMLERNRNRRNEISLWTLENGPLWVIYFSDPIPQQGALGDLNAGGELNLYGQARELGSHLASGLFDHHVSDLTIEWQTTHRELMDGFFLGLEMGWYRFKTVFQGPQASLPKLTNVFADAHPMEIIPKQQKVGVAVNLARHLVNLPPNLLNPESYSELIAKLFASNPKVSIDIWTGHRLEEERCHLLRSVGLASQFQPALVHIRYRPDVPQTQGAKNTHDADQPVVFVGKGITFDSGGLDIKDGASMRIMKKDMGGSATALAIAWWVQEVRLPVACDFYLALAENAIGSRAFRPGDIVVSRAGVSVEIDNTDAEGRLVLADAIDVAIEQNPKLKFMVNLSTLTGAMRVALGTRIAGFFTNRDTLAPTMEQSGAKRAEPVWRMPLHGEYRGHLKSGFADIANSGPQRFGGAISAAMFLHRFAGRVPWIHVDHYSWTDGPYGGCLETGGNGQMVQLFADLLEALSAKEMP